MTRIANFRLMALLTPLLATACAAGPDYQGPAVVDPISVARGHFAQAQALDMAAHDPVQRWWDQVGDATLAALVDEALANSPSIAIAEARIAKARAMLAERRADRMPNIGVIAGAAMGRIESADGAINQNIAFAAGGMDASWELDLAGRLARGVEAGRARADMAEAGRDDARVQLAAEVGQAYTSLRAAQQRHALGVRGVQLQQDGLALVQQRHQAGAANQAAVDEREGALLTAEGEADGGRVAAALARDRLAYLLGLEPGGLDARLADVGNVPLPPADIAVADPASLLRRRPDIRMAERRLAASNAVVGQAMAARFPQVSLTGLLGFSLLDLSGTAVRNGLSGAALPLLRWSLMDFGRTRARINGAKADMNEAEAAYRDTVLAALNDAAGALTRYGLARQQLIRASHQHQLLRSTAALAHERAQVGAISRIEAIAAETNVLASEQRVHVMEAGLMTAYVGLQKSLGLGWAVPK
ncbi:efflux transporter outer membrane subunit [Aquisediminimonas sediminicola]|uniref:efflux transporter outer membrane subunit n=1 Tax=Alteraquisediminimonas sediminicola TaxID=2676787 RepID=UPI001C8E1DA8|nr:efflux transporter outer membrane subunit [Aquisediminimonas sediminicola]